MLQDLQGDSKTAEHLFGMLHSISKLPHNSNLHSNAITPARMAHPREVDRNNLPELAMVFRESMRLVGLDKNPLR